MDSNAASLRALLVGYDCEVDQVLSEMRTTRTSGTELVQLLDKLRGSIAVHDSMVESVLCPLLDDLPAGSLVADGLRRSCEERDALLVRFGHLTNGVAARNVYPIDGEEIEHIVEALERSFRHHENDETAAVADIIAASPADADPQVVSARLAFGAHRAPSRGHKATVKHPTSVTRRWVYHYLDKVHDWSDTHHGWIR